MISQKPSLPRPEQQSLQPSQPQLRLQHPLYSPSVPTDATAQERRWLIAGLCLLALALLGAVWGTHIANLLQNIWGLQLNAHGHTHLYAHGHPFIDARSFWQIPNTLDVLSNLPFALGGAWGLRLVYKASFLPGPTRAAATVFFTGLMLTCIGSSIYHWAPSPWGLAIDRMGMAVAFAGVLGLAAADKISLRAASITSGAMLIAAALAIGVNYLAGLVLPWAVVQFGGVALVLWAAGQSSLAGSLRVRWGLLIGLYGLAKLLELGDETVYHATQGWVSGHTLKHVAASLAALPIIGAIIAVRDAKIQPAGTLSAQSARSTT